MNEELPTSSSTTSPDTTQKASSTLRKNLFFGQALGVAAMPLGFLILPSNFIIAMLLTQVFRLSDSTYGLIVSLPAWCNVAQLIIVPLLGNRWSQKGITQVFSCIHLIVWASLATILPYIPQDNLRLASQIFFILFFLSSFFHAILGVAFTSWIQEWVPGRIRGKYFGKRNRILQITTIFIVLGGSYTLSFLETTNLLLGFQIIIYTSVFLRTISILLQYRILSTSDHQLREKRYNFKSQIHIIRKSKPLIVFFLFGASFGFTASFLGPFFMVFYYEALHLGIKEVAQFVTISSIAGAIALPTWGRLFDRHGNRPVILIIMSIWLPCGYSGYWVTPERTWILYGLFAVSGFFSSGFLLGSFNMLLKLIPPEAKTTAISIHLSITSLTAAIAPILGGLFLEKLWALQVDKLDAYHLCIIIHYSSVLLTAFLLLGLKEPQSTTLNQAIGAMRSLRQIGALMGMGFFVNYVFTKRKRIRRK